MAVQIQLRRDTAANWTTNNPTLAQGEFAIETDTDKYKIGDGSTAWTSLGYSSLPSGSMTTGGGTFTGAITINGASPIVLEGATSNAYETTIAVTDPTADRTITLPNSTGTDALSTGNVATATALATARTIGGVSFDGTGNIADTLAATATALATARTIGGVSFDGTANIDLPGVNAAGNQNTSGTAATVTGAAQTAITSVGTLTSLAVSGGLVAPLAINAQTGTTYTFVLADAGKLVTSSNGSAQTFTVPPNSSVAYDVGTQFMVQNIGSANCTLAQGSGVTINSKDSNKEIDDQYAAVTLIKTATDAWSLIGALK